MWDSVIYSSSSSSSSSSIVLQLFQLLEPF